MVVKESHDMNGLWGFILCFRLLLYQVQNNFLSLGTFRHWSRKFLNFAQSNREGREEEEWLQKLRKCLNLLSRKYSLLCSLLFSYLNNSNEECNEMDHGREQNNHERAKKLSWGEREEKWGTCKLSRHVETIMLLYSLTIVLEILAIDDIRWR